MLTNNRFAEKCIDIERRFNTFYVADCCGAPLNGDNVVKYCTNSEFNKQRERTSLIKGIANKNYFGFDSAGLIKAVLWGWNGDISKPYGGAKLKSNEVPNLDADGLIQECADVSSDFSKIEVGEIVWKSGHIGVYLGNGLTVECVPRWTNGVQITAVGNIKRKSGYNTSVWAKHGKLPYVSYEAPKKKAASKKTEEQNND